MPSFGGFRLDLDAEQLWKGAKQVALRRKPMAILRFLVENPRKLVTHEELLANVWSGSVVSDSAVRTHLHELRHVLGEGVIETVIGRGYRFVAEITGDVTATETRAVSERVVVGREAELGALRSALARARDRQRQICFVTGEPGIGKTTLVEAFCEELPPDVLVLRGAYVEQFSAPEAYGGVIGMFSSTRGTRHADRVSSALVRFAPTLLAQIPQLIPEAKHDEVMRRAVPANEARIVRELLEAIELLAQQPLVLLLEDLQWSDVATLDLLGALGQRREPAQLLVIATSRRGEANTVSHPLNRVMRTLVTRHAAHAISVEPIGDAAIQQLVDRRFGAHALPPTLASILDRITGGTPLFVVAALDDLVSRGMIAEQDGSWRLVASLDEVAAHRADSVLQLIDMQLDRLAELEQNALEAASIVGFEFATELCAAALQLSPEAIDDVFDALVRRDIFLRREGTEEWPDGTIQPRYVFRHGLVFQVCHDRVSSARRQKWHRLVAERLEAAFGTATDDASQRLALHYEHARVFTKAIRYYVITGERTARRYASNDAHNLFTHAFELLRRLPESPERDALELEVLGGLSPSVLRTIERISNDHTQFQRMLELARRLDNGPRSYTALVDLAVRHTLLAEYERALAICVEMDEIASRTSLDSSVIGYGAAMRACSHAWRGEVAAAIALLRQLLAEPLDGGGLDYSILGPTDGSVIGFSYYATCFLVSGLPDSAFREAHRGLARARASGDPFAIGMSLMTLARLHFLHRDPPELAHRFASECLAMKEAAVWHGGATYLEQWSRSVDNPLTAAEADDLIRYFHGPGRRYPMATTMHSVSLIAALRASNHPDKALAIVEEMLAFAAEHEERLVEPELLRVRGELDPDPAPWFRRAVDVARTLALHGLELRAATDLARIDASTKPDVAALLARRVEGLSSPDVLAARAVLEAP
ncbi:MAG: AAA family ATPase [Kofleriaceae bacterium]